MNRDELSRIAHERLYPSLRNPNYLVLRARRRIFKEWLESFKGKLDVLDVGGRYQPYRPLFDGKLSRYIGLDLQPTVFVDVVGSGEQIPFRDATFDLVIATQVFEYFEKPHEAASQIHRVLRPGGFLLMSVPAFAPRFGNEDCWRYTPRGLRSLLSDFSRIAIRAEVSSIGGVFRFANLFVHDSLRLRPLQFIYRATFCPLANLIGAVLERALQTADDRWTANYSVMARK